MFKTQQTFQESMEGHPQKVIPHFCQTEIKWKPDWRELYIPPRTLASQGITEKVVDQLTSSVQYLASKENKKGETCK